MTQEAVLKLLERKKGTKLFMREIAKLTHLNKQSTCRCLKALIKSGFVQYETNVIYTEKANTGVHNCYLRKYKRVTKRYWV